jgi:hypothetical protein
MVICVLLFLLLRTSRKVWMSLAQAALSFLIEVRAPWENDWIWGCPLIVVTVIIHVFGLGSMSQKALLIHNNIRIGKHSSSTAASAVVIGAITLLATILHALEAAIWAVAYLLIGALTDSKSAMLYSLGALTTYGHQSLFLEEHWRLLGTIEALNGWLLFGLSTAFLFFLIQEVSPKSQSSR